MAIQDILKPREIEVLRLMAEGLTNREISARLFISVETVKWYAKQIYEKLDVKNRSEASQKAQQLGLLDVSEQIEVSTSTPRYRLPQQTTPFIGRDQELDDLQLLISDADNRLVTILAPGGMGKTRLAQEVARQQIGRYSDGVYFVALEPLNAVSDIVTAIADTIGFTFHGEKSTIQQLIEFLEQRAMLLVLDNFEHLLDGASLLMDIMQIARRTQMLVTSRERLNLRGETVYSLRGLEFPTWETPEDAMNYDAVQLFMQSAKRASSDFTLQISDLDFLARICRLTAGMPLGIELAAGWVDILSLEEIATEIQQSIDFLSAEMRDLPRRQWSIRAVYEPTWNRLTSEEQNVFMRFSVFRGGCTRHAAQTVTGATLRHLQTFANKALLTRSSNGRYEIHSLLRQYADEKLTSSGLSEETHITHAQYYASFMEQRESVIKGQGQLETMEEITSDFDNCRTMWLFATEYQYHDLLNQALECLCWYTIMGDRYVEVKTLFRDTLNVLLDQPENKRTQLFKHRLRARLLYTDRWRSGNYKQPEGVRKQLTSSLVWMQHQENDFEIAYFQYLLADVATQTRDNSSAKLMYNEALAIFQHLDDRFYVAWTLHFIHLHSVHVLLDLEGGLSYVQQALAIRREIGDVFGVNACLYNIGSILVSLGDRDGAEVPFREMVMDSTISVTFVNYAMMSHIYLVKGDFDEARKTSQFGLDFSSPSAIQLGTAVSLWTVCILACIDEDYAKAKAICEEIIAIAPRPQHRFGGDWGLALANCGLGDYEGAIQANCDALYYSYSSGAIGYIPLCFPAAALIAVHLGQSTQAVELLSLVFNHPIKTSGWIEKWSVITDLMEELEDDLSTEGYQVAWERGKSLDINMVAQDLIRTYNDILDNK